MWPFDRRAKVPLDVFVATEADKVFSDDYVTDLRRLLAGGNVTDVPHAELVAFLFFITQAAANLAGLSDDAQRELIAEVYFRAEAEFGRDASLLIEDACFEYYQRLQHDYSRKSQFLVETMTLALTRLVGTTDESVVLLRLALLKVTLGLLNTEKALFQEIRVT